jgi:N-acetylmuramoyl-L-alanine amidase
LDASLAHRVCVFAIDQVGNNPNNRIGCKLAIPPGGGDGPGVVITPTGVTLPVLEVLPHGYLGETPCGNEAVITVGEFRLDANVVLDAGHGGSESGAAGSYGVVEKHLNLDVAFRIKELLENAGLSVVMTRYVDVRVPLRIRGTIAESLDADLFVSIHHNGGAVASSSTVGTEIYYQHDSEDAKRLGGLVYEELREAASGYSANWVKTVHAGVTARLSEPDRDFYGIHRYSPNVPSVIAEWMYLSNYSEAYLLSLDSVRAVEAEAIASAILRWYLPNEEGYGFISQFIADAPSSTGGFSGCVEPDLGQ